MGEGGVDGEWGTVRGRKKDWPKPGKGQGRQSQFPKNTKERGKVGPPAKIMTAVMRRSEKSKANWW